MVATEGDPDQQHKNNVNPFSSLGRQSSIYSLTLDEFQHTLCESGKNFGSMNMDEFLTSIWTAEENQATNTNTTAAAAATTTNRNNATTGTNISSHAVLAKQPSLPRQASLTLPAPLCRKTVEEVWSEIHGDQNNSNSDDNNGDNVQNPESAPRQPTFGEMTLEDFLVRAGVVREQSGMQTATVRGVPE
jgi:ABA responsive element binding factor